jgi:hypothetical protein
MRSGVSHPLQKGGERMWKNILRYLFTVLLTVVRVLAMSIDAR